MGIEYIGFFSYNYSMDTRKKYWIILGIIFLLGALLRLVAINTTEITNDLSLNAFRAYGWLDFLVGAGQTSPIVWFGFRPWWSLLSFHDLPPLVMLIQYISLHIFGTGSFGALFPFILSSLLVIFLLFYFLKDIINPIIALLAGAIFSISSYAVWAARTGYLEGVAVLFIFLAYLFFILFLKTKRNKYLYLFAISTALSILSKYTAIFLIPAAIIYLLIFQRKVFKNKHLYLSIISFLILLTPIIIFNIFVFKTRGHFDAALSSMIGMHPEDYSVIAERGVNSNVLKNLGSIMVVIYRTSSMPLVLLYALAFISLLIKIIKRKARDWQYLLMINILMIMLIFSFSGAPPRFLSIINPFLAILSAWFIYKIYLSAANNKIFKYCVFIIGVIVILSELFYAINTNILKKPVGPLWYTYSGYRFYSIGFIELEQYIKNHIYIGDKRSDINNYQDLKSIDIEGQKAMLIDERIDWFSRVWYINRYMLYFNAPLFYFEDMQAAMQAAGTSNIFEYLHNFLDINEFYFVYVTELGDRSKKSQNYIDQMNLIKDDLEKNGIKPDKEIKDYKGDVVYKIYHFYINN